MISTDIPPAHLAINYYPDTLAGMGFLYFSEEHPDRFNTGGNAGWLKDNSIAFS